MQYVITTTAEQDKLLTWIVAQYNREHDSQLDNAQYITQRVPALLAPYESPFREYELASLVAKYTAAPKDIQVQVSRLLDGVGK